MGRLSIDGNLLLKDLKEVERTAYFLYTKVLMLTDGQPVDTMVVVNIVKARSAIKKAYDLFLLENKV